MPQFARYLGIDYSGAGTSTAGLSGLRVYRATPRGAPHEVLPPPSRRMHWTRRGLAEWLACTLADGPPTIVGIDHGFSFPRAYFETYRLKSDWHGFLDDFCRHWPTDRDGVRVDAVRAGTVGDGPARGGDSRWRRLVDRRAGAKSVFHFDVPGSVAKSTHAGLPWLRYIRDRMRTAVHFWPFDGWRSAAGRSVLCEVYPSIWRRSYARGARTPDQHDAYCVARWLANADRNGELSDHLLPLLCDADRTTAEIEGWILGVV